MVVQGVRRGAILIAEYLHIPHSSTTTTNKTNIIKTPPRRELFLRHTHQFDH